MSLAPRIPETLDIYFRAFETVALYSEKIKRIGPIGFILAYVLFLRPTLYLPRRPKIAVMVNTLNVVGD